jgi:hypothetical protein
MKEFEKICSDKLLNFNKFFLKSSEMSKYLKNKKVNAYHKRLQIEGRIMRNRKSSSRGELQSRRHRNS